jgi:hypothetical protein
VYLTPPTSASLPKTPQIRPPPWNQPSRWSGAERWPALSWGLRPCSPGILETLPFVARGQPLDLGQIDPAARAKGLVTCWRSTARAHTASDLHNARAYRPARKGAAPDWSPFGARCRPQPRETRPWRLRNCGAFLRGERRDSNPRPPGPQHGRGAPVGGAGPLHSALSSRPVSPDSLSLRR